MPRLELDKDLQRLKDPKAAALIQASRDTRASQNGRSGRDGDADLRVRARRAIDALESDQHRLREDYHDPRLARARSLRREDPLDRQRINAQERNLAELGMEVRVLRREAAARAASDTGDDETIDRTPDGRQYRANLRKWLRTGDKEAAGQLKVLGTKVKSIQARTTTSSDPDGAFFITPEVEKSLQRILMVQSALRSLATVRGLGASNYIKPVNLGGSTANWADERTAPAETNTSKLAELKFDVHPINAKPLATQDSLDDMNFDVEAWLANEVAIAFAEKEGDAFVNGDGVSRPRGLLTYTMVADTAFTNQTPNTFGYVASGVAADLTDTTHNGADTLLSTIYRLRRPYRGNASWLMNEHTLSGVRKYKDTYGQYLINSTPLVSGEPERLLGYAFETDENFPDIGANAYPIAFGDVAQTYLILDRLGVRVLRNPYSNQPYIEFWTRKRVGGGAQWFESMKFIKVATS